MALATIEVCVAEGVDWRCDRPRHCTGLCMGHYTQIRRGSSLRPLRVPVDRTQTPAGFKWCSGCKRNRSVTEFHKKSSSSDGLQSKCVYCASQDHRMATYALTPDEYEYLLQAQGNACGVCETPFGDVTPHIDHDHSCCGGNFSCGACIRGATCGNCNRLILAGYEGLPEPIRDWDRLNQYITRRPIRDYRIGLVSS